MEHPDYRNNLIRVDEKFPHKELLTKSEVAEFLGINRRTVSKYFSFPTKGLISKASLARQMCQ